MEKRKLINAVNIRKSFKDVYALRGVDLSVYAGEFVAILGPNGAGKTTLVEIIEGIQTPDSGDVVFTSEEQGKFEEMRWNTHATPIYKMMGLSLQETHFFERINVEETLWLFASFYEGVTEERILDLLKKVGLLEKRKAWTMHLSGGQRQKLALAVALLHSPKIILLDEPTTGLDPHARREIWELLFKMKNENNSALILTTHYMEEAQVLCDRIVIIDQGKILEQGTLEQLLKNHNKSNLDELFVALTGRRLDDESFSKAHSNSI
ncbi:MAG: ABC transporter ATP-binding protein [Oligoflexia bacterium]|nr:ABC transporter ATP-binding protein [Oligoflexia bacterium]MBF0364495.1 ABC transporter ATP-binding protein [Oligoflexia bacterium]